MPGWAQKHAAPDYLFDIEDARILGVKPWEIEDVPLHWREKARIVNLAKKQALQDIAAKNDIGATYVLGL